MLITKEIIVTYVKEHFSEQDIKWGENGIQVNSPFKPDTKFHLGISLQPQSLGQFNDFKPPQESGSFFKLVSLMSGRTYDEAKMYIIEKYFHLIDSMQTINFDEGTKTELIKKGYFKIDFPKNLRLIYEEGKEILSYAKPCINLLHSKGISDEVIFKKKIMFGYGGEYNGYVFIPFFNDNDDLIYWVSRHNRYKRYKNAPNKISEGKGSGIAYNVNTDEENVVLTEGIFDALRLKQGIALLGNKITDEQVNEILKKKRKNIIIAMDNYTMDSAGKDGAIITAKKIYEKVKGSDINVKIFKWESEDFCKYKDFSRCPFDVDFNMINQNSENYNHEISGLKVNMFHNLENDIFSEADL
jgi:hypothetical protein